MKLASLRSGRDGKLLVVSADLATAVCAGGLSLQGALDDWRRHEPRLRSLYEDLNRGRASGAAPFVPAQCAAPLPRAFQWCDGSAYLNHAELVRKMRNSEMPASLYSDPLIYQGGSDVLLGPCDDFELIDPRWGLDLEAEIGVIVDDVPIGVAREEASGHIRLVALINDWSLRNLIPAELAKQFGFYQSKPPTAFAPVVVTPDEITDAWDGHKLSLPVISHVNGAELGRPNAGVDLNFDFPALIVHATKTRPLSAGTIIGSGTISNRDRSVGSSCIQERRALEVIESGAAKTPFLTFGDRVRVEVLDAQGASVFGAIEQRVVEWQSGAPHHA